MWLAMGHWGRENREVANRTSLLLVVSIKLLRRGVVIVGRHVVFVVVVGRGFALPLTEVRLDALWRELG